MMNVIRKKNQDLEELLEELKIGDDSIFDEVTSWNITRVPGGFIYKNEYAGAVFVPYENKKTMADRKIEKPVKAVIEK